MTTQSQYRVLVFGKKYANGAPSVSGFEGDIDDETTVVEQLVKVLNHALDMTRSKNEITGLTITVGDTDVFEFTESENSQGFYDED